MLRLTLGIPGFDEAQLPRVVAALCLTLLLINRVAGGGEVSAGQVIQPRHQLLCFLKQPAGVCCCAYCWCPWQCLLSVASTQQVHSSYPHLC